MPTRSLRGNGVPRPTPAPRSSAPTMMTASPPHAGTKKPTRPTTRPRPMSAALVLSTGSRLPDGLQLVAVVVEAQRLALGPCGLLLEERRREQGKADCDIDVGLHEVCVLRDLAPRLRFLERAA